MSTARELVDDVRGEVQIFGVEPLQDGFASDPVGREGVRILRLINRAYADYVWEGFNKCYLSAAMTIGTAEYRLDKVVSIASVDLLDAAGRYYPLRYLGNREALRQQNPQFRNRPSGRPRDYVVDGQTILFDPKPDSAYTYSIYGDIIPDLLVAETDVPNRLDAIFHEALTIWAAYRISRMASQSEAARVRAAELKEEEREWRRKIRETAQSRVLTTPDRPAPFRDNYRAGG